MVIIKRSEAKEIEEIKKWAFIYGRRKTGKTFLVKNFLKYDEYFFVKTNKSIISEKNDKEVSYDLFIDTLKRTLAQNGCVVVDEFHRLDQDFFDFLHYLDKKGKLILISSTLNLSKKLLSQKSALLGLFAEFTIGLLKLEDVLKEIKKHLSEKTINKKMILETAIILREPYAIEYFNPNISASSLSSEVIIHSIKAIPAMIGEIFSEEERSLSAIYEGILRATGSGHVVSTEISSYLFSRKLIPKDDPSVIQQYLINLIKIGILKKIKVYDKNRFVYKHVSPLARLYYYADEMYNITEREVSHEEAKRISEELLPRIIEDNVREFLAQKLGLEESIYEAKDFDIDACLLKFKKIDTAVEIKWKDKIEKSDVIPQIEKLRTLNPKKIFLFVPDKNKIKETDINGARVVDVFDFID